MVRYISAFVLLAFVSAASAQIGGIPQVAPTGTGPDPNPPFNPTGPDAVNYQVDDGTAEDSIGLTGTGFHDLIWLNRFNVQAGGEIIDQISVAYGSAASTIPINGRPISILLYNDPDGGAVTNATLVHTFNTTITQGNTGILVNYAVPNITVSNQFLVGVVAKNQPNGQSFLAAWDSTDPDILNTSFIGFTAPGNTMNEGNLASIGANFGAIETFGATLAGNWLVRARGDIPEPTSLAFLSLAGLLVIRRR